MKRIKHNDLTHYFIREHSTLPRAYLRKCEKFFKSIKQRGLTKKEERLGWITRGHEPQASSLTEPGPGDSNRIIKEKL